MYVVLRRSRGIRLFAIGLLVVVTFLYALNCTEAVAVVPSEKARPALQPAPRPQAMPFTAAYYTAVNERFGVGLNARVPVRANGTVRGALITDYNVESLHIGWYSDWQTNSDPLCPGGIKYAQLIKVRASEYPTSTLQLTETIAAKHGALWIIGNEPEGKYSQGNRTPAEYAEIYHYLYTLIKGLDSSAWVAIGGVIEPTPLRLQWLEMVLDEYQSRFGEPMPVDVWNIHVQILQEKAGSWGAEIPAGLNETEGRLYTLLDNADPDIFRQLVIEFRQWMKGKGFQNKPLIISEYGVLMPSTYLVEDGDAAKGDQKLIDFMRATFDFLVDARDAELGYPADDHRLVQQWLWFSLNTPPYDPITGRGYNGSLFSSEDPKQMTKFGFAFREYIYQLLGYPRVFLPLIMRRVATFW